MLSGARPRRSTWSLSGGNPARKRISSGLKVLSNSVKGPIVSFKRTVSPEYGQFGGRFGVDEAHRAKPMINNLETPETHQTIVNRGILPFLRINKLKLTTFGKMIKAEII